MYHMKRASVRDLRYDFPKVEKMLAEGESIEITKRNQVIGTLTPANIATIDSVASNSNNAVATGKATQKRRA